MKLAKLILITIVAISPLANMHAQKSSMSLISFAESMNKSCPQEAYGGLIRILGFSYQNKMFESRMEINMGDMFDIEKACVKPKESKELISMMLANMYKSKMSLMFDQILKENATYKMVLSSMYVSDKLVVSYTPTELKTIFAKYGNLTSYDRTLLMQVHSINLQAPIVEDEFTTMDKAELTDASLIYYDTLDDKTLGTGTLGSEELSNLKEGIIYALSQSPLKDNVINSCLKSFRTITYVYTMKYSHNQYKVILKSNDLKEILK